MSSYKHILNAWHFIINACQYIQQYFNYISKAIRSNCEITYFDVLKSYLSGSKNHT